MNMRNTFAETMPDTIGEKHNGGATSDSYVIDTGYECEEGVETAKADTKKKSGGGFGRADVILLFIGLGIGGCFTAIAFCCGKCMAPKKQLA